MKKLFPIFALLFSCNAHASWQGDFSDAVGGDKRAHAIAGVVATALTYTFTDLTIGQSFAVGVGVGLLKEVADSRPGGTGFDSADFAYTTLGSFASGFAMEHLEHIGIGVKYKWQFDAR